MVGLWSVQTLHIAPHGALLMVCFYVMICSLLIRGGGNRNNAFPSHYARDFTPQAFVTCGQRVGAHGLSPHQYYGAFDHQSGLLLKVRMR